LTARFNQEDVNRASPKKRRGTAILKPLVLVGVIPHVWEPGQIMAVERFYIYRSGATDSCAVTATKNDERLIRSPPLGWRFWKQITRNQGEDGRNGFSFDAAEADIKSDGFFLFRGSPQLLDKIGLVRPAKDPINV
jgi:hypothetical protein